MTEYSFSQLKYNGELQKILRTKGEKTNYQTGKSQIFEKKTDDNIIIQSCTIKEKIKEDTDAEGNDQECPAKIEDGLHRTVAERCDAIDSQMQHLSQRVF